MVNSRQADAVPAHPMVRRNDRSVAARRVRQLARRSPDANRGRHQVTKRRIKGSEVRTAITKSLEHFIETAPWRLGWPALELAVGGHTSAAADVERIIQFNVLMAENHIQSMISALSHHGSGGPALAARSALEATGRACWIAEPEVDDEERLRRALRSRYDGATQALRLLQSFDRAGAGTPDEEQRLTAKIADLEQLAARTGVARSKKGRLLLEEPTDTELIQHALSWLGQPERGRMTQTLLSATVHSGADLIGRTMLKDVHSGPAGPVFAVRVTRWEQLSAASSAGIGYVHLLKSVAPLFRMNSARSDEMVSKLGGAVVLSQGLDDVDWSA